MKTEPQTVWDQICARSGRVFENPHKDLRSLLKRMGDSGGRRVLDVGSGSGRHLVFFGAHGLEPYGIDNSPEAVMLAKDWLNSQNLHAEVTLHDITTRFPYPDEYFDGVIAVQVIHHGVSRTIRAIADEMDRVSRTGALLFVTVPRLKNQAVSFLEIEPDTFVPLEGPEKGLPHHFFSEAELALLFPRFRQIDVHVDDVDHWCLTAVKEQG